MENTNEASRSLASAIDIGFLDPKRQSSTLLPAVLQV